MSTLHSGTVITDLLASADRAIANSRQVRADIEPCLICRAVIGKHSAKGLRCPNPDATGPFYLETVFTRRQAANPERGVYLVSDRAHQHFTHEMDARRLSDLEAQANQCAQMDGE